MTRSTSFVSVGRGEYGAGTGSGRWWLCWSRVADPVNHRHSAIACQHKVQRMRVIAGTERILDCCYQTHVRPQWAAVHGPLPTASDAEPRTEHFLASNDKQTRRHPGHQRKRQNSAAKPILRSNSNRPTRITTYATEPRAKVTGMLGAVGYDGRLPQPTHPQQSHTAGYLELARLTGQPPRRRRHWCQTHLLVCGRRQAQGRGHQARPLRLQGLASTSSPAHECTHSHEQNGGAHKRGTRCPAP